MSDHAKPTVGSNYADVLSELDGRLQDLAVGLDSAVRTPTNLPTGAVRWSSAAGWWQKWSGTAWGAIASVFKLPGSLLINATAALLGEALRVSPASGTDGPIALFGYGGGTNNPYLIISTTDASRLSTLSAHASVGNSELGFNTNGAERLRIAPLGNVGIGTNAPATKLHVSGASGAASLELLRLTNTGSGAGTKTRVVFEAAGQDYAAISGGYGSSRPELAFDLPGASAGNFIWSSAGAEYARFSELGYFGVGTSAPTSKLTVNGDARVLSGSLLIFNNPANNGNFNLSCTSSADFLFKAGATERMRIDGNGYLLLGKSDTTLTAAGGTAYAGRLNYVAATGTVGAFYNAGASGALVGSIAISTTATSYNTTSDYRLKTPLVPIDDAVQKVLALRPGYHGWLADPEAGHVPGWYAHELQQVVPTAVTGQRDEVDEDACPVYQAVDNSKVVPLLAAALQAALRRIEQLETRLGPVAG